MKDDLDELPVLWRAAEAKYPPTNGWGLKIVRRWLTPNEDAWIVQFSRSKGGLLDRETFVGTDAPTVTQGFRDLLDPSQAEERLRKRRALRYQEEVDRARKELIESERRLADTLK